MKIAVIDDDPFVSAAIQKGLFRLGIDAQVHAVADPTIPPAFDVYVVDNDFGGTEMGTNLFERVRALEPTAEVIVFSAGMRTPFLQGLMRLGARSAFDKESARDRRELIHTLGRHQRSRQNSTRTTTSLRRTLRAVTALIREWNLRLEMNR